MYKHLARQTHVVKDDRDGEVTQPLYTLTVLSH